MVAGGLNEDLSDYSAAVADMAIAMRDLLRRDFSINASHLEVRIGIGTGPIVAGVLGKKKFIYDLWGDTVNIASRITSEGVPGMIQCDTMTYHRLAANFDFHEPQTIYLKGKGNMTVYRLIGRKGVASEAHPATRRSRPALSWAGLPSLAPSPIESRRCHSGSRKFEGSRLPGMARGLVKPDAITAFR
jgi:adenylate cyclase